MDYKATLNLPKTSFPMKGNLSATEPKILQEWERQGLYQELITKRREELHSGRVARFILHDGPPYANGDIHMGHALNKVLKDIIVRYQMMQGKFVPFVPGWDCHGLPIEYQLMKELNVTKHQVDTMEFRRKARAYALKYVGVQREQFKRLGCLGDWEHPYLTLEPGYVATALRALKRLVEKGFIYRGRRPVNWCWSCETALAEAEVEYEPHTSPSIYVKFELEKSAIGTLIPSTQEATTRAPATQDFPRAYLIIWTTTPWTLLGNVAVAVHPSFEYAVRRVSPLKTSPAGGGSELWITASQLPRAAYQDLGLKEDPQRILQKLSGEKLKGLRYQHPLLSRQGQVVLADYVTKEEGTGLVHTAPGFGEEDYQTGKEYGLELLAPVDAKGCFAGLTDKVQHLNGLQVQEANKEVIQLLEKEGDLLKAGQLEHSYPHCWRCHEPIIFRATDQWFLKVDHQDVRKRLLQTITSEIRWIPPEGKERMTGMVQARPDWCLSRQRLWGIPIPAVICTACGEGILDPQVIERFAQGAQDDPEGSDRWFTEPVTRWLPEGFRCRCGASQFTRGTDILDVWFDSGVSHQGVLKQQKDLSFPADLYLEGSDQHRGWFQVSLIAAIALEGEAPYRGVLTHGFVVDGEGRKMSKSLGNVIAPQEVVSFYGADVLRLWVGSCDYREDVRLSQAILSQTAEVYRKIRNTLRFCLANVSDFDPSEDAVPLERMEELDRWAMSRLSGLFQEVSSAYEAYAFHRVVRAIHEFSTVTLSNFYLDVIKDRLYTFPPEDSKRRSCQTVLFRLAETLILLISPILPMTAQEAWQPLKAVPGTQGTGTEVTCPPGSRYRWPLASSFRQDPSVEEVWGKILELRDQAMKALEEARQAGWIGDPLEAELEVAVRDEGLGKFLQARGQDLATACIVSSLKVIREEKKSAAGKGKEGGEKEAGAGVGSISFHVQRAPGKKCERCWMIFPSVGQFKEHPTLCHRCVEVLRKVGVAKAGGGVV